MNPKQERFCQEYVIDLNGTQAAIRAGYSEKTANEQAARMLANVSIKAKITELQSDIAKSLGISAEWIIERLKQVAERCMQAEPVMIRDGKEMIESGEYKFDSSGANKALELLGKHVGVFEKDNEQKEKNINLNINKKIIEGNART